ncbi:hypothetical protein KDA_07130 [Dictyobacter alpinus]|uniref:Uncharacterized protein n=1 Tax=Dictyobacter alpinus TaxID=2014873 RepID=A0A402B1L4_9CHLR|nr:hypothetical protein [Dictyobacter alpinus]GCE25229.1 hypothetical protein KDA_07130 [Dictyobacter alpinus]
MGGSSFDLIAQELQKQNNIMEEMKAENLRLRQQLTDLRAGKGVFLEINGTRIALDTLQSAPSTPTNHTSSTPDAPFSTVPTSAKRTSDAGQDEVKQVDMAEPQSKTTAPLSTEKKGTEQPTFLEEIMLDEFQSALTAPHATWSEPDKKSQGTEEEQKAALRRELMGSFLLE